MTIASPPLEGVSTTIDLSRSTVRELNQLLHDAEDGTAWAIESPMGSHNIAVGINADVEVTVHGNVGYYFAGMHQAGTAIVHGSAGVGLAENIMSGVVHVTGDAS